MLNYLDGESEECKALRASLIEFVESCRASRKNENVVWLAGQFAELKRKGIEIKRLYYIAAERYDIISAEADALLARYFSGNDIWRPETYLAFSTCCKCIHEFMRTAHPEWFDDFMSIENDRG